MTAAVSPTQSNLTAAIRSFLLEVLPAGTEVIAGVVNRVPEPRATNFVTMIPIRLERLRTNVDTMADCRFIGSIAALNLTVTAVTFGTIRVGAIVNGTGVTAGTRVVSQTSGSPGGVGVYVVSASQTVASRVLATGQREIEQGVKATVQLDFHTAGTTAADLAQIVSTTLRDPFGVEQFANQTPNYGVVPLYADDPRYIPFINEAQQYEWRWMLEACFQINQTVVVPQQYADGVVVELESVDASFPPA